MKLSELLQIISNLAQKNNISTPFICGGVPRDKILNRLNDLNDIDLTTGDSSIHLLAEQVNQYFGNNLSNYSVMPDGHARINLGDLKLDFSSNFIVPGIENWLKSKKLNFDSLNQEVYSRDFTCNSLLLSLDLKRVIDPTEKGLSDIKNKILTTCLNPKITLGIDHKRVVRVLYLAAKLDFEVNPEIIIWIKNNPASISDVKPQYLSKKLNKALDYNLEKTLFLLDQMNLWKFIPPLPRLIPYMKNPNRL